MTSTETMESMFQLQGEIDMLNERVHKLEEIIGKKSNNNKISWKKNKLYIVADPRNEYKDSYGEWHGEPTWSEYDTFEEAKIYADKVAGCILDSSNEFIGIYTAPNYIHHIKPNEDEIIECFIFHKEARRSRI